MKISYRNAVAAWRLPVELPRYRASLTVAVLIILGAIIAANSSYLRQFNTTHSNRVGISGTVHYLGKPLDRGSISFVPQILEPEYEAVDLVTSIRAGAFDVPRQSGPEPALFLVSVLPDPEPAGAWRDGGTCEYVKADDNGEIHARMKDSLVMHIRRGRHTEFHFRLN